MTPELRVAMVMPPVASGALADVVEGWSTVNATVAALHSAGVVVTMHGRHDRLDGSLQRNGGTYRFHLSDAALASAVASDRPDVVHVHGLGWTRLLRTLRHVGAPLLLQHHGEPVFTGRARWGHRLVRGGVAGYLFTGASEGQVEPWIRAGVVRADAPLFEVLEAASMLPDPQQAPVVLPGAPSVLWVGRLIEGKAPVLAVEAFAAAGVHLPDAHLHLLATDRTLEPQVRATVEQHSHLRGRVHIHPPVPHHQMAGWYGGADVYFSTSQREGSGYSLIEAMNCGCAPVVTAIPPHVAIAADVGTRFAVGDVAGAAQALVNVSWRSREPSRERSRIVLSWEHVAHQLVGAYRRVARRRD